MCHLEVQFHQETFILDSARALYHAHSQSLIIADVHLGKTTHFRKHGIAIPTEIANQDLKKLAHLIHNYNPLQVIIAGDFFHATANSEIQLFKKWREQFNSVEFILIKGNHDKLKLEVYDYLGLQWVPHIMNVGNFDITHLPLEKNKNLTICGHIHPGVSLKLKSRQFVKLPSFIFQPNQIILPAFSEFTGLDTSLQNSGKNFVITENEILEV